MMDLETPLSMTQQESVDMVASAARDFAEKYVRPHIMEWDEKQHFPVDVMRLAGQHGFWEYLFRNPTEVRAWGITNM